MMKKLLFFLLLFTFSSPQYVSAQWYWNYSVAYSNPGVTTLTPSFGWGPNRWEFCLWDGDSTGGDHPILWAWAVANNNNPATTVPETDAEFDVPGTGNMRCLLWDASLPQNLDIAFTTGWTNTNRTISVEARDRWGSRLKRILLEQSTNAWAWIIVADWDNLTEANNTLVSRSWTRSVTGQNGNTFQYRISTFDYAWNSQSLTNPDIIRVDTQTPLLTDISNSTPADNSNILAESSRTFSLSVWVNGGSPIVETTWYFEDRTTTNSYRTLDYTSLSWNFSHNFDIRNVDLNRWANGSRQYSLKITRICDQAWNCTEVWNDSTNAPGIRNFTYNVYANTLSPTTSIIANPLTNVSNIADGSVDIVQVRLRDIHNNIIIPTTGPMVRNISFQTTINNNLRLNQYDISSTPSWLFTDISTWTGEVSLWVNTKSFWNVSSSNGDYDLSYFVFAPTSNASPLVPGSATVTNITFSSTGLGPAVNSPITWSNFSVVANPLFTTSITGNIETQWFIEWVTQTWSVVTVTKLNSTLTSSNNLYFEFGNYNTVTTQNEANNRYNISLNGGWNVREGIVAWNPSSTIVSGIWLSAWPYNLSSRMLLQSGAVNTETTSYLATIVRYQVWSPLKTVIYPADIIGKTSYHGTAGNSNSFQSGIKIIGNTSSQNTAAITTNQFSDDVQIIGKIEKSLARKDIQESVYEIIRNITPKVVWWLILSGTDLQGTLWTNNTLRWTPFYGSGAIYFATWVTVSGAWNIEGTKTLVVEWNVYITGNIRDTDNDAMLGIIALSKNGLGWNIYINPDVTDIHALLYADRSVLSYDGTKEFDGSNSNASELNNQLYVKGSIFSENTIWGSRKTPIACPFFVGTCTQDIAQKYDMNYLRRYFIYDSNANGTIQPTVDFPANGGSRSIGGWIGSWYETYPVVIDYNTRIQQSPPPFFGK
jgi:hypothetical protein